MKKLIILIGFGLYMAWFCQVCDASPFLVSDPSAQAVGGKFEVWEASKLVFTDNNQPDGSIKMDLAGIPTGDHSYNIRYVKTDALWGTLTSDYTPFSFTRPSIAGSITGIKIVK